jgi:peptidoglycan/xylan/chitin deacetylase (PgdA/CDA1 family)
MKVLKTKQTISNISVKDVGNAMSTESRYYMARYGVSNPYLFGLVTTYLFARHSPLSDLNRLISTYLKYDANATFFIVGSALKGNLEKLELLKSNGFDIAPHGNIHIGYNDRPNPKEDMQKAIENFRKAGVKVSGFRPPGLVVNHVLFEKMMGVSLYKIASDLGLKYLSSTISGINDTLITGKFGVREFTCNWADACFYDKEYRNLSNQEIYSRILPHVKNGNVLLFHSQFIGDKNRINILEKILSLPGITFISIEDALKGKEGVILTSDVGTFSRRNLLKRFICS